MIRKSIFAAILLAAPAVLANETPAEFFLKDRLYWSKGLKPPADPQALYGSLTTAQAAMTARGMLQSDRNVVAQKVRLHAAHRLGPQWSESAVRLAKIESGWRCHVRGPKTRHGRAIGPLQIMPGSARALGYTDMARLSRDCDYQIAAGVAHMQRCLQAGARKGNQMAACHVAGWGGYNKRLNRKAEAYKRSYVRVAALGRR